VAAHNGFDLTLDELNKRVDAYYRAGVFDIAMSGEALDPSAISSKSGFRNPTWTTGWLS
jgi:hypothetical protein